MNRLKYLRQVKNEKGVISFDFLFALILVMAFFTIFFSLTFALSLVEVVQYISFATTRTYMAGHFSPDTQTEVAIRKYQNLTQANPVFGKLFKVGWVIVPPTPDVGDHNAEYDDAYPTFWGAKIPIRVKVLERQNPLFGATYTDDSGFKANVTTFLTREPTFSECMQNFQRQRYIQLKNQDARYQPVPVPPNAYVYQMVDNGC